MEQRTSRPSTAPDATGRRIRRAWISVELAFAALAGAIGLRVFLVGLDPLGLLTAVLMVVAAVAVVRHRQAVLELETGGRAEAESFARILSRLSRSVSGDAVVAAIVDELVDATGADHVVVARRRPDANALDAHLVSAREGIPDSTTILPATDLGGPIAAGPGARDVRQQVADRIATRVRTVYGLAETLAAPLTVDGAVVGAIILSHRPGTAWSPATRRVLAGAAVEASAALARATSFRAAEARATTDPLTGLPNRRYLDEYSSLLARRRRSGDAVGVLMIDVDRFKALNDRYGHPAGDAVLRAIARAIVATVRDDDMPARYGGEEFAVLLRDPSRAVALEVGERVRAAVAALDLQDHGVPGVTVSVGVAVASDMDQPIAEVIDRADQALYRAKRAGRDRVVAA